MHKSKQEKGIVEGRRESEGDMDGGLTLQVLQQVGDSFPLILLKQGLVETATVAVCRLKCPYVVFLLLSNKKVRRMTEVGVIVEVMVYDASLEELRGCRVGG